MTLVTNAKKDPSEALKDLLKKLNKVAAGTYGTGIYVEIDGEKYFFDEQTGVFVAAKVYSDSFEG